MTNCQEGLQWVGALSGIFTGAAAFASVVVAGMGLGTWRRQLKGKIEYETARRVLRAPLDVRENIRGVRSPFISVGEMRRQSKMSSTPMVLDGKLDLLRPPLNADGLQEIAVATAAAFQYCGVTIPNCTRGGGTHDACQHHYPR